MNFLKNTSIRMVKKIGLRTNPHTNYLQIGIASHSSGDFTRKSLSFFFDYHEDES